MAWHTHLSAQSHQVLSSVLLDESSYRQSR